MKWFYKLQGHLTWEIQIWLINDVVTKDSSGNDFTFLCVLYYDLNIRLEFWGLSWRNKDQDQFRWWRRRMLRFRDFNKIWKDLLRRSSFLKPQKGILTWFNKDQLSDFSRFSLTCMISRSVFGLTVILEYKKFNLPIKVCKILIKKRRGVGF